MVLAFGPLGLLTLLLRLAIKVMGQAGGISWEDYTIVICAAVTAPALWAVYSAAEKGVGKDIWKIPLTDLATALHRLYMGALSYKVANVLNKISILLFYLRLFPTKNFTRAVYAMMAFSLAMGFSFVMADALQCSPPSYFWRGWDGEHIGHCVDFNSITWAHSGINIASDVIMIALPIHEVRKLRLPLRSKISVAFVFALGFFVTIVSILRLQTLTVFNHTTNPTWDYAPITYWSVVEICVGIICANLPAIYTVFVKAHHRASSRSGNISNQKSGGLSSGGKPLPPLPNGPSSEKAHFKNNIEVQRTYSVSRTPDTGDADSMVELVEIRKFPQVRIALSGGKH